MIRVKRIDVRGEEDEPSKPPSPDVYRSVDGYRPLPLMQHDPFQDLARTREIRPRPCSCVCMSFRCTAHFEIIVESRTETPLPKAGCKTECMLALSWGGWGRGWGEILSIINVDGLRAMVHTARVKLWRDSPEQSFLVVGVSRKCKLHAINVLLDAVLLYDWFLFVLADAVLYSRPLLLSNHEYTCSRNANTKHARKKLVLLVVGGS